MKQNVVISKKRWLLLLSSLVLLAFLSVNARLIWRFCKPTLDFKPVTSNAHVLYEPGAQGLAEQVALWLPDDIKQVEREQYKPFKEPVSLYVCATTSSFAEFTMLDGATAGCVSGSRIFISPALAKKAYADESGYVTHELSHAHLQQYTDYLTFHLYCPNWFKEGLAVYVSNGAGAGLVSDKQAIAFIKSGCVFEPAENGLDVITKQARRFSSLRPWPMPIHMFYRQSMMFVSFLKEKDPVRFKRLIEAVEGGGNFRDCFISAYGTDVQPLWNEFIQTIKQRHVSD